MLPYNSRLHVTHIIYRAFIYYMYYVICASPCLVSKVLMRVSLMLSATGVALTRAYFNLQTASA